MMPDGGRAEDRQLSAVVRGEVNGIFSHPEGSRSRLSDRNHGGLAMKGQKNRMGCSSRVPASRLHKKVPGRCLPEKREATELVPDPACSSFAPGAYRHASPHVRLGPAAGPKGPVPARKPRSLDRGFSRSFAVRSASTGNLHVPSQRFEPLAVRLHHGDRQMPRLAQLQVTCDAALAFVRAGHHQAAVAILQLRGFYGWHAFEVWCKIAREPWSAFMRFGRRSTSPFPPCPSPVRHRAQRTQVHK